MIRNSLYQYGEENARVPAHLHYGKEIYDNMLQNKDGVALINSETNESMTYGTFAQLTVDIALSLTRIGVGHGDIVSICSEKLVEFLPTVQGVLCAGAVFSPTDPTSGNFSLIHRFKIAPPKIMFCSVAAYDTHRATLKEIRSIQKFILYGDEEREGAILFKNFLTETAKLEDFQPAPVDGWEDKVYIMFSSGTTGLPKGIPFTHLACLLNSQCYTPDYYKGAVVLNTRQWYYSYGLTYSMACLRVGATLVYAPSGEIKDMLEAIQKHKITVLQLAPLTITELINSSILDNYDVTSVMYIISSSTYIREEAEIAVKKRFPNLVAVLQFYGMSEGGSICNKISDPTAAKSGSSGTPSLGLVMKVVDMETRKPLGPNERGEICIKGPSVMKAYVNNLYPDSKDEEGFLKTGDIGYYDADGFFYIVNRIKEIIKFNDFGIAPAEFEAVLLEHPAVREAGVVGKPHPTHGEAPVAFVVLHPGRTATEEELVNLVNSAVTNRVRLAGGVRFLERLPYGAGDKLNRQELKRIVLEEVKLEAA